MDVCLIESVANYCDSKLVKLLPETISDYIRFGSIAPKVQDDTPVTYFEASGISNQVINALIRTRVKNDNYTIDLVKDNLTVSIFHWYGSTESKYWKLVSEARFTEPRLWFQDYEKPPSEGNGSEEVKGGEKNNGEKFSDGEEDKNPD